MKQSLGHIQLIFVVSRSRSGSTLLQTILNSHPNIIAPIESKFVLHLKSKYQNYKAWDNKLINQFVDDLFTNRKIRLFWNVKPQEIKTSLNSYTISSFSDACKAVYLSFPSSKSSQDIKVIIDKNPAHARFTKELHLIFPDANFIHLIRDPRATIYSQIKAFNKKSISNLAFLWVSLNQNIIKNIKALGLKSLHIKYENLVQNPEQEISSLMSFLDLKYDSQLLNSHKKIKPLIKESNFYSLPHHRNTGNPINTKSLEKWKNNLNKNDVKIINTICFEFALKNGYQLDKGSLSFSESIKYQISKNIMNAFSFSMKVFFNSPFLVRKVIYTIVSFFFDKKYTK